MRIKELRAAYPSYKHLPTSWRTHLWQIVVRVETDVGVTGLGSGGGGRAAVEVVNGHFRELCIGQSVDSIEDISAIWDEVYAASIPYGRKGVAVMALSGLDLALWDLLGQAEGVPVCQLLGGPKKGKVRVYATGPDTEWYQELGIDAQKFAHRWTGDPRDYDEAVASAARIRDALGPDAQVMIDTYMSWDRHVTQEMAKRLREHNIHWFEDVLTPDELEDQAELRDAVKPALIAGGEHEFTHHGFAEIAKYGALDLWQPDITWCGGVTAGLRILALAEQAGIPVVPHRGGEAWGLHFIVATNCEDSAKLVLGTRGEPKDEIWIEETTVAEGYLTAPERPGFGVELNPNRF